MIELLHKFQGVLMLCLNDITLDRFIYGEATYLSLEASNPVVVANRTVSMPSGWGNVVRNLGSNSAFYYLP